MKDLLLLHGAIGSSAQLRNLAAALSGNFRVHAPDFPGHGGSPATESFSIAYFAASVTEYCRKNKLDRVSIFGYSMGGYVALALAKEQPQLVEKVITLATKFAWDEATSARESKMLVPEVIEAKVPEFAAVLKQRHAPSDWKLVLQQTAEMLKELGRNPVLTDASFAAITQPVLLLLGDRDRMVGLEETTAVYQQLSHAQLAVLPATPHPVDAVDTDLLAFFIRRFLGQETGASAV